MRTFAFLKYNDGGSLGYFRKIYFKNIIWQKKNVLMFLAAIAIVAVSVFFDFRGVPFINADTPQSCVSDETCPSGTSCNNTVCCPAGTCGWGDDAFQRECVASGLGRENSWARLVCRNGAWKTRLYGWGCKGQAFPCDSGLCNSLGFCMSSCTVDPGVVQSCSSQGDCPSGTVCSSGACCPAGYCGWGDGVNQTRTCLASGITRETLWGREVCNSGVWYTPKYGWGCDLFGACQSGSCQMIGDYHYCYDHLPIPSSSSSFLYDIGNNYCAGTCRGCAAQGVNCGITSDNCGGYVYCGTCASGYSCSSNQCVASCTPNCSGKACGSDGCGGSCGTCASGYSCNTSGQCVASCVPSCSGKACGSDGCGGSCGTCASGYSCNTSGQCVAGCTNECTIGARQCAGIGYQACNNYDSDSCVEWSSVTACASGESCSEGICVADDSDCVQNYSKKCYNGDAYWYDSCGGRGDLARDCGADSYLSEYRCNSTILQQRVIARGCDEGVCQEEAAWVDAQNCAAKGQVCRDNVCKAEKAEDGTPPTLYSLLPSGTITSSSATLSLITNEAAECRYSYYDVAYDQMGMKFNASDGIRHSAAAILSAPGNYVFYVRCKDASGNANSVSGKISFTYGQYQTQQIQAQQVNKSNNEVAVKDKTPPEIELSGLSPTAIVDRSVVELALRTTEKSSCRYDIADTDFVLMENDFESDMAGTFHRKTVTLLVPGNYSYYVRCKDVAGNANAASLLIAFEYTGAANDGELMISDGKPFGTVYQKLVALEAVTSSAAVCRYAENETDFDSMEGLFSTSDDLRHTAVISLDDFGDYRYYVCCEDQKGEVKDGYGTIQFVYKDPAVMLAEESVAENCAQIEMLARDGACDNAVDCVCDPDCPIEGEDVDMDCTKVEEKKNSNYDWVAIIFTFSLIFILVIIILGVLRGLSHRNEDDFNE